MVKTMFNIKFKRVFMSLRESASTVSHYQKYIDICTRYV